MTSRTLARAGGIALTTALLAGVAAPAMAGSFYVQEQSTRGQGRANAGVGADKGVQSLWWNPAAIAGTQREVYTGMHGLILDSSVDNRGSTLTYNVPVAGVGVVSRTYPVNGDPHVHDVVESGIVPNFAISTPIGDRFNVGLAVQAPYNFTTKYLADDFARYDALTSELRSANVSLVAAAKVTDWLDIGAGFDAQYAKATLSSALPNAPIPAVLSPAYVISPSTDGRNQLEGDGWNYGWNAGAQMHFGKLDLGLSYRSEIKHELDGTVNISGLTGVLAGANVSADGTAKFTTPWYATLSARYAVNDRLTLNAQVNQIGWSKFDAIRVNYGATGASTIVQDYDDVTTGAVGFDYKIDPTMTFRAGVGYDPTPTPDDHRTARIPDGDRWLYAAGLSKTMGSMTFDGAVTYIDIDTAAINDTRDVYGNGLVVSNLRGEAKGNGVGFSLGATWNF
ncbi:MULTISPECIES: OmpP1/FadL family transporter [unclassified Brevundimonas]|uniref:OmpP1/FadL family transporter n=1 Tax=unclassified Brevundimonas TaxID=2622653 RepID=UPI000E7FB741|nr:MULTISPECIES: outer membrane protein transport protein [unclassified Brevundimonas]MCK6105614.1 outer membrane protein transport protein [Brevundimonas sp. EYE_349]HBI20855.1 long-chain fatty acid transporter [Brevundimonas sp.]